MCTVPPIFIVEQNIAREPHDALVRPESDSPITRAPASRSSIASKNSCPFSAVASTTRPSSNFSCTWVTSRPPYIAGT